jgi:hypothetical protein
VIKQKLDTVERAKLAAGITEIDLSYNFGKSK